MLCNLAEFSTSQRRTFPQEYPTANTEVEMRGDEVLITGDQPWNIEAKEKSTHTPLPSGLQDKQVTRVFSTGGANVHTFCQDNRWSTTCKRELESAHVLSHQKPRTTDEDPMLTSPWTLAKASKSILGDQTMKRTSVATCFSSTWRNEQAEGIVCDETNNTIDRCGGWTWLRSWCKICHPSWTRKFQIKTTSLLSFCLLFLFQTVQYLRQTLDDLSLTATAKVLSDNRSSYSALQYFRHSCLTTDISTLSDYLGVRWCRLPGEIIPHEQKNMK